MRKAWRHTLVYGKYVLSMAPGFRMETISSGRRFGAQVIDEPNDPSCGGTGQISPAPIRTSVQSDIETLASASGLIQRPIEQLLALFDGKPIVLRVAHHIRPAEIVGLECRGDGEKIIELRKHDEMLGASPATQYDVVVVGDILTRSTRKAHGRRAAGDSCAHRDSNRKDSHAADSVHDMQLQEDSQPLGANVL